MRGVARDPSSAAEYHRRVTTKATGVMRMRARMVFLRLRESPLGCVDGAISCVRFRAEDEDGGVLMLMSTRCRLRTDGAAGRVM